MTWRRRWGYPTHNKWLLIEVHIGVCEAWFAFFRNHRYKYIVISMVDGKVQLVKSGLVQSTRKMRRQRLEALAAQIMAYLALMGNCDDFPLQDKI